MGHQDFNEKDGSGLQTVSSFRPGASSGILQDYADPEVQNEAETTHKGEFGTKRDLVSCGMFTCDAGSIEKMFS